MGQVRMSMDIHEIPWVTITGIKRLWFVFWHRIRKDVAFFSRSPAVGPAESTPARPGSEKSEMFGTWGKWMGRSRKIGCFNNFDSHMGPWFYLTQFLPLNGISFPQRFRGFGSEKKQIKISGENYRSTGKHKNTGVLEFTGSSAVLPLNGRSLPERFLFLKIKHEIKTTAIARSVFSETGFLSMCIQT